MRVDPDARPLRPPLPKDSRKNADPRAETWWDCPRGRCQRMHRMAPVPLALTTHSEHRKTHARARRWTPHGHSPCPKQARSITSANADWSDGGQTAARAESSPTSKALPPITAPQPSMAPLFDVGSAAANRGAAADGTERLIPQASFGADGVEPARLPARLAECVFECVPRSRHAGRPP